MQKTSKGLSYSRYAHLFVLLSYFLELLHQLPCTLRLALEFAATSSASPSATAISSPASWPVPDVLVAVLDPPPAGVLAEAAVSLCGQ